MVFKLLYNKGTKGNTMDLKNAKHKDVITRIKDRQKTLKWATKELKKHFVGLDKIIGKIAKDIEA